MIDSLKIRSHSIGLNNSVLKLNQVIDQIYEKNYVSEEDLNTYMNARASHRSNIVGSMDLNVYKILKPEALEKLGELILLINIGLSPQNKDTTLLGEQVNVSLKEFIEFLRNQPELEKYTDQNLKIFGLNLFCACMHKDKYKQGNSLTSTVERILRDHNIPHTSSSINNLKLMIATGYCGLYKIFKLSGNKNLSDDTEVCANDFRSNSKNKGEFVKFSEEIKSYKGNYIKQVSDNMKSGISKFLTDAVKLIYNGRMKTNDNKIEIDNIPYNYSKVVKQILKSFINEYNCNSIVKTDTTKRAYDTLVLQIPGSILYINYFLRKAVNSKAANYYKSGTKTQNNSANVSFRKVSITYGFIRAVFKRKIGIDITLQEAFILAATCSVQNEGELKTGSIYLNESVFNFFGHLLSEPQFEEMREGLYSKKVKQKTGLLMDSIHQDWTSERINDKIISHYLLGNHQVVGSDEEKHEEGSIEVKPGNKLDQNNPQGSLGSDDIVPIIGVSPAQSDSGDKQSRSQANQLSNQPPAIPTAPANIGEINCRDKEAPTIPPSSLKDANGQSSQPTLPAASKVSQSPKAVGERKALFSQINAGDFKLNKVKVATIVPGIGVSSAQSNSGDNQSTPQANQPSDLLTPHLANASVQHIAPPPPPPLKNANDILKVATIPAALKVGVDNEVLASKDSIIRDNKGFNNDLGKFVNQKYAEFIRSHADVLRKNADIEDSNSDDEEWGNR